MKCLESYLKEDLKVDFWTLENHQIYACRHFNGLSKLLLSYFVYPNQVQLPLPTFPELDNHQSVVDHCIIFMLYEKLYSNILTHGYRIGSNQSVGAVVHCNGVNSSVALLKSAPWRLFHQLFGTQHFANLIVNHCLFTYNNDSLLQVAGGRISSSYYNAMLQAQKAKGPRHDINEPVKVRNYLYKNSSSFKYERILPSREEFRSLRESLTDGCPVPISNVVTNQIDDSLRRLLVNHRGRIKYLHIFNNICPKPDSGKHLGASTPVDQVLKFLIVVLGKLLSSELFGSNRNKAVIFGFVSRMLNLPVRGSLRTSEILAGLRFKDFRVFRPPGNSFSREDLERTTFLVRSFLSWIFKNLIPVIISSFFYCTEMSSSTNTLFFRHDTWNQMSLPALRVYLSKFMTENTQCRNHQSYTLSKFNHNRLRIIPKKANGEFRIIAIPMKGADDGEYKAFQQNLRNVICPVQCVLEHLRNRRTTQFEKLYSANQIATHLGKFKSRLLRKYGQLPKLHYLKFDIDSCYDFIPREKVISVVSKVLLNDSGFFVRSQSFYDTKRGTARIRNIVNGSWEPVKDEVYIDNVRTYFISAEDLMQTIKVELFESALSFSGKCYLRKSGLFQGTSLSALLVNLVYDELLEHYEIFHSSKEDDTLVLRLADDFLVLSTNESRITKAREGALNGFAEFNATVNKSKLTSSLDPTASSKFSFCGLEIDIGILEVSKGVDSLIIHDAGTTSTTKLYKKVLSIFEARLSYGTTSLLINSSSTVLDEVELIASGVADSFVLAFRNKKTKAETFSEFFERLSISATRACCEFNNDVVFATQIRLSIASSFMTALCRYTRFEEIIKFLKEYSMKLLSAKINSY